MANPAGPIADKADAEWLADARKVRELAQKKIDAGVDPSEAVRQAWREVGIDKTLTDSVAKAIGQAMTKGIELKAVIGGKQAEKLILGQFYDVQGTTLATRIWNVNRESQQVVLETVRTQWRKNQAWTSAAQNLHDVIPPAGDVPKFFGELNDLGRKAMAGDIDAYREFRKVLANAEQQVERLSGLPVSTERLKAQYKQSLDRITAAMERQSEAMMDRALKQAIYEKARYNAMRLARTEAARGYWDGFKARMLSDEDVVGWRSVLSSSHEDSDCDVCDFYAETDLHGMGPGVFPKDYSPDLPYHPHCMCTPVKIFRGEAESVEPDDGAAKEYIDGLTEEQQKSLMGKAGMEVFKENPDAWQSLIKNNQGYSDNEISSLAGQLFNP